MLSPGHPVAPPQKKQRHQGLSFNQTPPLAQSQSQSESQVQSQSEQPSIADATNDALTRRRQALESLRRQQARTINSNPTGLLAKARSQLKPTPGSQDQSHSKPMPPSILHQPHTHHTTLLTTDDTLTSNGVVYSNGSHDMPNRQKHAGETATQIQMHRAQSPAPPFRTQQSHSTSSAPPRSPAPHVRGQSPGPPSRARSPAAPPPMRARSPAAPPPIRPRSPAAPLMRPQSPAHPPLRARSPAPPPRPQSSAQIPLRARSPAPPPRPQSPAQPPLRARSPAPPPRPQSPAPHPPALPNPKELLHRTSDIFPDVPKVNSTAPRIPPQFPSADADADADADTSIKEDEPIKSTDSSDPSSLEIDSKPDLAPPVHTSSSVPAIARRLDFAASSSKKGPSTTIASLSSPSNRPSPIMASTLLLEGTTNASNGIPPTKTAPARYNHQTTSSNHSLKPPSTATPPSSIPSSPTNGNRPSPIVPSILGNNNTGLPSTMASASTKTNTTRRDFISSMHQSVPSPTAGSSKADEPPHASDQLVTNTVTTTLELEATTLPSSPALLAIVPSDASDVPRMIIEHSTVEITTQTNLLSIENPITTENTAPLTTNNDTNDTPESPNKEIPQTTTNTEATSTAFRKEFISSMRQYVDSPAKPKSELELLHELKQLSQDKEDAVRQVLRLREQVSQLQSHPSRALVEMAEREGDQAALQWARTQASKQQNSVSMISPLASQLRPQSPSRRALTPAIGPRVRKRVSTPHPKRPDGLNNGDEAKFLTMATETNPDEFDSEVATYIVRRPYAKNDEKNDFWTDVGELSFSEYQASATVGKPSSLEIVAKIKADGSILLLSGSSNVRHKKPRSKKWKIFENVDEMDKSLGSVMFIDQDANEGEYWLDEIYEEAMSTRDTYCSSLLATASALKYNAIQMQIHQQREQSTMQQQQQQSLEGIKTSSKQQEATPTVTSTMMQPPKMQPTPVPSPSLNSDPMNSQERKDSPTPVTPTMDTKTTDMKNSEVIITPTFKESSETSAGASKPVKKKAQEPPPADEDDGASDILSVMMGMIILGIFHFIYQCVVILPLRLVSTAMLVSLLSIILSIAWFYLADDHGAGEMGASLGYGYNRAGIQ